MLYWSYLIWVIVLLLLRGLLEVVPLPSVHDLYGVVVVSILIAMTLQQLKRAGRQQLRPFVAGVALLWAGLAADYLEDSHFVPPAFEYPLDVFDDLAVAIGFFLIGIAFLRLILERDALQERLYAKAYRDELTGLGNRRALFEQMEPLLREQDGQLIYIDINHFKPVNDRFGHHIGDEVLRSVAQLLAPLSGHVYRIGGDEFVLVLPASANVKVEFAAVDVAMAALSARYGVSLSLGTAAFSAGEGTTVDALLHDADQRMYTDKRRQRER
ncbi:GGDEF domain-containing protein [Chitinibacteraceae bacterium HSL-7]